MEPTIETPHACTGAASPAMHPVIVALAASLLTSAHCHHHHRYGVEEPSIEGWQAEFAVELLRHATEGADGARSVVISPFSVGSALAIASAGAAPQGTTRSQIDRALARDFSHSDIQEYFTWQQSAFMNESGSVVYRPSSLMLAPQRDGLVVKKAFADAIVNKFNARIRVTDYSNTSTIIAEMNQWVRNATDSRISSIATQSNVTADPSLVLASAVYLNAEWAKKFNRSETFPKDFYVSKDKVKRVDMMPIWAFGSFRYTEDAHVQLLGVPCSDNNTFLYMFLPRDRYGLDKVVEEMNGKRILALVNRCRIVDIEVEIPAFRIESAFSLKEALIKMDITDAFASNADFSSISTSNVFVSSILHKTVIEVAENGTETSEALKPNHRPVQRMLWQGGHLKFIADHPFLFAVVRDDVFLFFGRFT